MSGGARNEKRRQQQARQARLAAAGITVPQSKKSTNRLPLIIVGVVLAVVVVVVLGFYLLSSNRTVAPSYPATASGAVVTAGSGPVVVDMYEDFLCPGCQALEQRDGAAIVAALNANKITVRYHMLGFLDAKSKPAGYSTRAADASICAAAAGIYGKYHEKLYAEQPAEGSAGLTDDQLVTFGTELGATGDFATCVKGTSHDAQIKKETDTAKADAALKTNGQFVTPTVTVAGKLVDVVNNANWLSDALAGK